MIRLILNEDEFIEVELYEGLIEIDTVDIDGDTTQVRLTKDEAIELINILLGELDLGKFKTITSKEYHYEQ